MSFVSNATSTTELYTLSLHDALPISAAAAVRWRHGIHAAAGCAACRQSSEPLERIWRETDQAGRQKRRSGMPIVSERSEEHTSELQSLTNLVCRLLLEKKKKKYKTNK